MFNFLNRIAGGGRQNEKPAIKTAESPATDQSSTQTPPTLRSGEQSSPMSSFEAALARAERNPIIRVLDPAETFNSAVKSLAFNKYVLDFINNTGYGYNPNPYSDGQLLAAYMTSVYLFAALRRVSNLISRVKVYAEIKQGNRYVRAPETVLINRIFDQDGSSVFKNAYLNYAIYGSAVIFKTKTRKAVESLFANRPIYDYKDQAVAGLMVLDKPMWELDEDTYNGEINGLYVSQRDKLLGGRNYLERQEFIYLTDWNPENPNRGRSIVTAAIHEAVTDASISRWSAEYFTRGAMPFIMVSMEDDPTLISDPDLMKYKRQFEEYWQGVSSSVRSVFFDRKVNVEQVGIPAGEIGAPELKRSALEGISAAVGLDRELIVTPEGGSQERHDILVKRAWDDTIIPMAEEWLKQMERQLGLPPGMRLRIDVSHIKELEAERGEQANTEISILDAGVQSINEVRKRLNMPPINELEGFFKQNGELMSLDRIIRQDRLIDDKMMQQVGQLWDSDLLKRSEILRMLGRELPEGAVDGYKTEVSNAMQLEMERKTKLLEFEIESELKRMEANYAVAVETKIAEETGGAGVDSRRDRNPFRSDDNDPPPGSPMPPSPPPSRGGGGSRPYRFIPDGYMSATASIFLKDMPNSNGRPIDILTPDAALQVVGRTPDSEWLQVYTAEGQSGWLRKFAVETMRKIESLPVTWRDNTAIPSETLEKLQSESVGLVERWRNADEEERQRIREYLHRRQNPEPQPAPEPQSVKDDILSSEPPLRERLENITYDIDVVPEGGYGEGEEIDLDLEGDRQRISLEDKWYEGEEAYDDESLFEDLDMAYDSSDGINFEDLEDILDADEVLMLEEYGEITPETWQPLIHLVEKDNAQGKHTDEVDGGDDDESRGFVMHSPDKELPPIAEDMIDDEGALKIDADVPPSSRSSASGIVSSGNIYLAAVDDIKELVVPNGQFNPKSETKPHTLVVNNAFACVWLAGDSTIAQIQNDLRLEMDLNPELKWQDLTTLHLSLAYSDDEITDPKLFERIRSQLPAYFSPITLQVGGLVVFENETETVIALNVWADDPLLDIQKRIYDVFAAQGLKLSDYSNPDKWIAHITLCYAPAGTTIPMFERIVKIIPKCVCIQRGEYETVYEIPFGNLYELQPNDIDSPGTGITHPPSMGDIEDAERFKGIFRLQWVNALDGWKAKGVIPNNLPDYIVRSVKEYDPFVTTGKVNRTDVFAAAAQAIKDRRFDPEMQPLYDNPLKTYLPMPEMEQVEPQKPKRAMQSSARDELAAWERKTIRGNIRKGLLFETHHIPPQIADEIKELLKRMTQFDTAAIQEVFEDARNKLARYEGE